MVLKNHFCRRGILIVHLAQFETFVPNYVQRTIRSAHDDGWMVLLIGCERELFCMVHTP